MSRAQALIAQLGLAPHPEGGFYRETFRSPVRLATPRGERSALTVIHFLLPSGAFSAFHRVQADEVWHHVSGDPLELLVIDEAGLRTFRLDAARAEDHAVVPAGAWQAARPVGSAAGYALVSCDVAPGFDFADFEMATAAQLAAAYPALADVTAPLCR